MSIFGKKPDESAPANAQPTSPSPTPAPAPTPQTPAAAPQPQPQPSPGGKASFLGSGCVVVGQLRGDGSLECAGSFEGTIDLSGDVLIGHGGNAKAEVTGRRINIEGRLKGNAIGAEKVEVGAGGHVEGDVRAPAVQFAEGAFFEGNVEMRRPASAKKGQSGDSAGD